MSQCHQPVPSYRRGQRDQEDPPLHRQTSPPLPPHPWDRPLPWAPWIPLDLCRHGDPRRPWDPGVQSGCPRVREVRGVPAARPLRPYPVRVRIQQQREKSPHVVYPPYVDDFPFPLQNFFTVSSGNAMTALTRNNLYHQPIK
ncbi:hypothetical protein [Rana esculenta virus]|uniref:Uncharacterized protein n=1 Tax=Rana esculenta virus TaxID=575980 RepID=A0A222NTV1_9VIRU|nr:hypothetical protein [Rana esculenta virus]